MVEKWIQSWILIQEVLGSNPCGSACSGGGVDHGFSYKGSSVHIPVAVVPVDKAHLPDG